MTTLDNFHWLHGLDEYFNFIQHIHHDKFKKVQKAVQYGESWPIRDLMLEEIKRGWNDSSEEFVNIAMLPLLAEDMPFTNEQVLRFLMSHVDDGFLYDMHSWISYYNKNEINLDDHFSRGQMMSKLWMVEELRNVLEGNNLGTVLLYGGWYATISHMFFKFFSPKQVYSIDVDPSTVKIADEFNRRQSHDNNWQFKAFAHDVNSLQFDNEGRTVIPADSSKMGTSQITVKPTIVINTSCEHMNDDWFYNLPDGQFVILQTNNYFENPQHSNCVSGVQEALDKYKFSSVYYKGELETFLYNRYMIIGVK